MTDHLSVKTARAPRKRDEAAAQGPRRRARKQIMTERDLAELEALLIGDLQDELSPPLAAEHGNDEPAERPLRRPARVRRRPVRLAPQPAENSNTPRTEEFPPEPELSHPRDLDEGVYDWDTRPEPPLAPRPRHPASYEPIRFHLREQQRRSIFSRAMSVAASIVSVIALLGVSALLVLLAVGGEGRQALFALNPAMDEEAVVAADSVNVMPPTVEKVEGPAVIAADGKQDASRIPTQDHAMRGGGIVRAVDASEASAPAPQSPETLPASETVVASIASPNESAVSAAPAPVEPPAPPERPVAQAASDNAEAARTRHGDRPARTARVTSHVNMRAKPENEASVVAVVPQGKDVRVVDCERWCQVGYDGKQGYIHERFLKE